MNGKLLIALAAAFGGISPNLLSLSLGLIGDNAEVGKPATYAFGLLLFAAMGGATALIWGEKIPKRAYFLGLGLPGMVQAGVSGATAERDAQQDEQAAIVEPARQDDARMPLVLFASPAYAQSLQLEEPPVVAQTPVVSREIILKAPAAQGAPVRYRLERQLTLWLEDIPAGTKLVFTSENGAKEERYVLKETDDTTRLDLRVPDFASHVRLSIGEETSEDIRLQSAAGSTGSYKIDVDTPFWSGLRRALGEQNVAVHEFKIEPRGEARTP